MRDNKTKAKLYSDQPVYGVVVRFPSPTLVEMFGFLGFDFIMLDSEHGSLNLQGVEELLRAAELSDTTSVLRIPFLQAKEISRALDIGVQGIQVPNVNTIHDARAIVHAAKFSPEGERGMALGRGANYGMTFEWAEYLSWSNKNTLLIAHIESLEAVKNLPEIVTCGDLDVLFVGPADLSQSMGLPGQLNHPEVLRMVEKVVSTIRQAGKIAGVYASNAPAIKRFKDMGCQYLLISADNLIRQVGREYLAAVRA